MKGVKWGMDLEHGVRLALFERPGGIDVMPNPWDLECVRAEDLPMDQVFAPNDARPAKWAAQYEANRPVIDEDVARWALPGNRQGASVWDIPACDVVTVVGAGPSLARHRTMLAEMGPECGVRVGTNAAVKWVPNLDYFVCIDADWGGDARPQDTDGRPEVEAILDVSVAPRLARLPWKRRRWVQRAARSDLNNRVRSEVPGLFPCFERHNVMPAVFQIIARVWRPKVIILVGCDCGFTGAEAHPYEPLVLSEPLAPMWIEAGIGRRPVLMTHSMDEVRRTLLALCAMATMQGVTVVNATEGGALPEVLPVRAAEQMPLERARGLAEAMIKAGKGEGAASVGGVSGRGERAGDQAAAG